MARRVRTVIHGGFSHDSTLLLPNFRPASKCMMWMRIYVLVARRSAGEDPRTPPGWQTH